ncbi:unnamed protein product [Heligmosomoides polygyrus]|uniref:Histone-lysine N-methyltransferase SETMAR n=1 Tax=Heligmosomoides polygyrus TaxID=6339 RepID=A0A183GCC6_HELPZ|nr:unnamed protein product [Heligmosomoides polygyrus]
MMRKEQPGLDKVRLLHENARPHIAKSTSQRSSTAQIWPQLATTFFDHFSIIWKGSVMKIVTTSKKPFELFSPPSRRISTPEEFEVLWNVGGE